MYRIQIWPTEVAGSRAVPRDVQEGPGRALHVHSAYASPILLFNTGV